MTNGEEFRLYKTFIPNVISQKDRLLLRFKREELLDKWEDLYAIISYENLVKGKFDNFVEKKLHEFAETIVPRTLSDHLKLAKNKLVPALETKISKSLDEDRFFYQKFEQWVSEYGFSNKSRTLQINKLARMTAYNFITKFYFCRILEDKNIIKKRLNQENIKQELKVISIRDIIRSAYASVLELDYRAIFETRFFDSIYPDDDNLLVNIISSLGKYDFSKVDHDILGRIYEQHIDKKEKKELGQYYTPTWIIKYILRNIPISTNSLILDPACGSGGFLIHAYNLLYKKYLSEGFNPQDAHRNILEYNLFGFDINPFAVMLSAANLALRNIDITTEVYTLPTLVTNK